MRKMWTGGRDGRDGSAGGVVGSAWVTMTLDFFRVPQYMTQFPLAHTLTMTYRVEEGAMEIRTRSDRRDAADYQDPDGPHECGRSKT